MAEQKAALDFDALRRAIEQRDLDSMLGLYAEDAEMRIVNYRTPPGSPFELRGKAEISEYLRDVFGREMIHRIEREVVGEDRVAYNEACEYPDGTNVFAGVTLDVRDGKISRYVEVVAWDE